MKIVDLSQTITRPFGSEKNPNWDRIDSLIDLLSSKSGAIRLTYIVDDSPKDGPLDFSLYDRKEVTVNAENGQYLLIYNLCDRNMGEEEIFSYDNTSVKPGEEMVEIIGDYWDASMVCTDLEIVRRAFKEFYETGDFWMENFLLT